MTRVRPYSPRGQDLVEITAQDAGWSYCGLRVLELDPGRPASVRTGHSEAFVLPMRGGLHLDIEDDAGRALASYDLTGRDSVFTGVSDFAYVGRDSLVTMSSSSGAEVAIPTARCETTLPPRYGPAADVPVEVRGAGTATRQVTNFGVPGVWDHAVKLVCCELITPPGNWSSYPPHKHDVSSPCPTVNEEIYYYRIAGVDQMTPSRSGFGFHRTYTGPEHEAAGLAAVDDLVEVRDHDVVLVPYGYHGPCVAGHGYPMYYLNVMAGPAVERSMAFCDDPPHAWVRDSWSDMVPDPRCPVTSASGRVDGKNLDVTMSDMRS